MAAVTFLAVQGDAQGYIGPGAGFAVAGSFLAVFAVLVSAVFALFTWPVRFAVRVLRHRRALTRSRIKRVAILGLDGMDPDVTERLLAEGKLPHFASLRDAGCFKRLQTTTPPISPVAWSSFQTGSNPGKHSIFDFLTRDKRTYRPRLSSVDIHGPGRTLHFGRYRLPLGKPGLRPLRKGKPFWTILGEHGIFSSVLRVPITFPPEPFHGVLLSGMSVPDLRGTQGTFSVYTTRREAPDAPEGGQRIRVTRTGSTIEAQLVGPEHPFRNDGRTLTCPFRVTIRNETSADLRIGGQTYRLEKNACSDWIRIAFRTGITSRVRGICKFLLLNASPHLDLYVTPLHLDPERPAMPIGHPSVYPNYLAKRQGPFATLGLAEDTWALNENVLTDSDFIRQCAGTDAEREKMFFDSLDKVRRGLCVCVFDGTDRVQHAFWRQIDPRHPAHRKSQTEPERPAIEDVYRRMDTLLGKTLARCRDKDTVLMVVSDHGFGPFRRGVDINRWLEENGYLAVRKDGRAKKYLTGIDWSRTRAFAVGLAGIYLNLKGRESGGIVDPGDEAMRLRNELADKLVALMDPADNQPAVRTVYQARKIYTGPYKDESPDLIVGYQRGYRASWETAVGQVTEHIFHTNARAWSGDHCIDPTLVPGVLFCNRPVLTDKPRLMDIGPTVLDLFGIDVPKHMDGKPLMLRENIETSDAREVA